jgi:hypothetical protein
MGKKYIGKVCVYCGRRTSTTEDHVVARGFFLAKHRDRLPKVPACAVCNGEKSELEHYLTTVLLFGSLHSEAALYLASMLPQRLEKNLKLKARLQAGFTGDKIPLDPGEVESLFTFIAKGLVWHHWQALVGPDDCAAATVFAEQGVPVLSHTLSRLKPRNRVVGNLGEGTLLYEGLQTIDSPSSTLWRFLIYGGLRFGDPKNPSDGARMIFAATGPRSLMPKFWATVFRGDPQSLQDSSEPSCP